MTRPIFALLLLSSLAFCGESSTPVRPKRFAISSAGGSKTHVMGALAGPTIEGVRILIDGDGLVFITADVIMPSGSRMEKHFRVPNDRSKPILDRDAHIAEEVPQALSDDVSKLWRDVNAFLEKAAAAGKVQP